MKNVLEYLLEAAAKRPNHIAVADRDQQLTFSELVKKVRRIGAIFEENMTNTPIGVFVDRSVDTIAMILGVLWSGNYYVPLDSELPSEKLNKIIEESGMCAVLGNVSDRHMPVGIKLYNIDQTTKDAAAFPKNGGDDPIYMVYTSGSTGVPKGVKKSHKSVISFIEAYVETFDFKEDEIIGNQSPFFFDASAKDIYLMLKLGATMEIIPSECFLMPPGLIRYLNERKVTFISWVPSALCIVTQLGTFSEVKPETVKKIFFVGEAFPIKHLSKWQKALPDIEYVNLYGASEQAGISCYYRVKKDVSEMKTLPIGKPLGNCEVFLMDGDKRVTETGKTGEICIVSDALALEYHGDPVKTSAAFVEIDGKRTYRSGDLAWYDEEGNLNFAARNDGQIKHMGYRIELGEIEAVAGKLPGLERVCCLYNDKKQKICLFVQLEKDSTLDAKTIRQQLRGVLTDYMRPQKVIIKERLPQNANGKIDRVLLKSEL